MPTPEDAIQSAIREVEEEGIPQSVAAKRWGVPTSTLSDRLHGRKSNRNAKKDKQRLTSSQEQFIVDWLLSEEAAGRAPGRKRVQFFAQSILLEGGETRPLGLRWIDRFLRRHNQIHVKNGVLLERARAKGSTKEAYEDFFGRLDQKIKTRGIIPANIANMDEHGMQEMESKAGKVIGTSLTNKAYVQAPEGTTWVSVIECGTAEGKRLSPVVVFTGASLQGQWFPEEDVLREKYPNYEFDHSLTGWSNAGIALKWLNQVYLPQTKPPNNAWRLLIVDEHASHVTDQFMYTAWKNKVELLYLPPHTSHKTQPLDRSVFGPLKTYFREATMVYGPSLTSAPVNKQRFLDCYYESSMEGMCARNIISGFRKTGIWPFNPLRILDDPEALIDTEDPPLHPAPQPSTPPDEFEEPGIVTFFTPKKGRDILDQLGEAERQHRVVARKAAKALDQALTENASLRHQVAQLSRDLQAVQPHRRKKVKENPNDKFPDIEDIIAAKNASKQPPKKRRTTEPTIDPQLVREAEQELIHGLERIREADEC